MVNKTKYDKYKTPYNTTHFSCKGCIANLICNPANRIIRAGIGNVNSNVAIVLPTYLSYNEKAFNEFISFLIDSYKEKYNKDLLDEVYITPVIKCFYTSYNYDITDNVLSHCCVKTISEIVKHNSHNKIILIDDAICLDMLISYTHCHVYTVSCVRDILRNNNAKRILLYKLFKSIHI